MLQIWYVDLFNFYSDNLSCLFIKLSRCRSYVDNRDCHMQKETITRNYNMIYVRTDPHKSFTFSTKMKK